MTIFVNFIVFVYKAYNTIKLCTTKMQMVPFRSVIECDGFTKRCKAFNANFLVLCMDVANCATLHRVRNLTDGRVFANAENYDGATPGFH